jgi:hypothetical protein
MGGFKNLRVAWTWRTLPFLILFVILALPLQPQADALSISSGIFLAAQVKLKTILPQQKHKLEMASMADWPDQTPKIDPTLLRTDFKQNLLVWPNIANDLTRSPPFPAPVPSFS